MTLTCYKFELCRNFVCLLPVCVFNEKHATKVTEAETTSDISETLASPGLYCIVIVHLSIGVSAVFGWNCQIVGSKNATCFVDRSVSILLTWKISERLFWFMNVKHRTYDKQIIVV